MTLGEGGFPDERRKLAAAKKALVKSESRATWGLDALGPVLVARRLDNLFINIHRLAVSPFPHLPPQR